MAAAYDTYDYPSYWEGREYEHKSEVYAIGEFLKKIPKIKTILEIGAGYGRLTPTYAFRAKKVILSDSSASLLKMAHDLQLVKKIKYIHSGYENLPKKIRPKTIDLVVLVRVMHHIQDPDEVFEIVGRLLKKKGYFILEFANKKHIKATVSEFLKGNFTFTLDIFPKNLQKREKKDTGNLPFLNYHPDIVCEKLKNAGFEIIQKRSVSNVRSPFFKKIFPLEVLLFFEKILQVPLSLINFGPSIFILTYKKG